VFIAWVFVHAFHVVSNYKNGWGDSHQQADVVARGRKANQWTEGVQSDLGVSKGLILTNAGTDRIPVKIGKTLSVKETDKNGFR
jgi:hypothetical protein